ncbi:hypothetical protein RUMGNA_02854 [Mediterraneibacter gnavus ATCC 29149]|uniref:Uncharacterized protein n=1 Tax=Mediterraneibacter gnavus (strain ATCC 29149 / DSM 114966 / JCM 6515 / VPI C7-9) TaxID=411470 RepID=A7B5L5_MEDG7|nr:hypothetical protein RUMGNA_02854 [Mediterraneibacter gnavus ATCC 29149]
MNRWFPTFCFAGKRRDLKCTNLWNAAAKEGSLLWILWPDRKCIAGIFWGIFIVFQLTIFM